MTGWKRKKVCPCCGSRLTLDRYGDTTQEEKETLILRCVKGECCSLFEQVEGEEQLTTLRVSREELYGKGM